MSDSNEEIFLLNMQDLVKSSPGPVEFEMQMHPTDPTKGLLTVRMPMRLNTREQWVSKTLKIRSDFPQLKSTP